MADPPTIWSRFEARVAEHPGGLLAVDECDVELTFADAHAHALRLAGRLVGDHGVGRGDVVSWQLPNWLDTVVLCLALSRIQAIQNPIVPILREREVAFVTAQARSKLLVVSRDAAPFPSPAGGGIEVLPIDRGGVPTDQAVLPAPVAEPEDTVRWYFYTSGTTADPKGARHTDATLLAASRGMIDALDITDRDRVATLLPLTHVGGVIRIVTTVLTGSTMLVSSVFDPQRSIPFLRRHGATMLPGAMPFVHAAFDYQEAHPAEAPLFPKARLFMHGGSPKPPALHSEVRRRLGTIGIVSGYGMTECPMAVWNRPTDDDDSLAHTEGSPAIGVELRITDPAGLPVAAGTEGEIRLRGPQRMAGYVDPGLDAAAFDADGFLRSGDLGVVDDGGRLRVTGRLKDVIIRNMENISALELEQLLHQHPQVREVAVIGLPSDVTGELACAVVVPADAHDPPSLTELCDHLLAEGLSKRKLPERLELIDALPRNAMEKVRKPELARRFTNPLIPREGA